MKKLKNKNLFIPFRWVAITAYLILVVPNLLFFAGWLRWYLAILASAVLLFGAYWMVKKDYWGNTDNIEMPISILIGAIVAFACWSFISGNCYTSVAQSDIGWRNTTLCDLVNYDWPVYYPEKDGYLCYYFVFWLVPALVGKLCGGITAAYIGLAGWFIIILTTVFLLIVYFFRDYTKATLKTIIIFMIMWSGINILGQYLANHTGLYPYPVGFGDNEAYCDNLWNDGQPFCFLYRSNQDAFSQCYNQIVIWLAVPLMLQQRKIRNYAFIGLALFPFSPWGTVGIALMMIVDAICFAIKEKSLKRLLTEIFSIPNTCAVLSVFAVFVAFILCSGSFLTKSQPFGVIELTKLSPQVIQGYIIFSLCEFGIYYLLTWKAYKKDYLYSSVLAMLLVMPFIWVSSPYIRDFCMDATLPQLYVLMFYVIRFVKDSIFNKEIDILRRYNLKNFLMVIALAMAFTTPLFSWISKVNVMNANGSISIQDKSVKTFDDLLGYNGSYGAPISNNVDDKVFFKYLAKPIDKENAKCLPISDELSKIRTISDIDEYFDYLAGKDCTVFIAVRDIQGYCLEQDTVDKMKTLGFSDSLDVLLQHEYHSFIGIVRNNNIIAEQISGDEYISTHYFEGQEPLLDGENVWMESGTLAHGNFAVINIGDGYYSTNGRGLNVVVKDNVANRVIDSVAFDTHVEEMTCTRKPQ